MITKKQFIQSIEAIKKQMDYDHECTKSFQKILKNDYISGYDNNIIIEHLIKLLAELTKDKSDWIGYYVYELDFGKEYKEGCVTQGGKNIPLKTPKDLWNLITDKV